MKIVLIALAMVVAVSNFAQARTRAKAPRINQGFSRSFCLSQPNTTYRVERGTVPGDIVGMCYCGPAQLNLFFGAFVNVTKCEKVSEAPACYRAKEFLTYFSEDDKDVLTTRGACVQ